MAEDRRRRPDYSGEGSNSPRDGASDPLAELARLIGQSDPFAELGKRKPRSTFDATDNNDRPAPEWLARAAPSDRDDGGYAPRTQAPYVPSYRPLPYQPPAHEDSDYRQQARSDHYAEQDRYADDPAAHDEYREERDAYYEGESNPQDDRYRVAVPSGQYDSEGYYAEDGHMPPQEEEGVIGPRRRGGLLTVMAVLGLAVIGTAGALGYRAFTSGSSAPANPPVIKADPTPPKTVPTPPPQQSADAQAKPFQDRVAAPAERVVPREEQPVSLPITPPAPRVTAPQPSAQAVAPLISPPAPTSVSEPKRVKTVTIRQEPADSGPMAAAPSAPPPSARPPATRQPTAITPQADAAAPSSRSKLAARTPAAASGAYVVQVSAQRTEAEAQSSYEALQSKYPSVLGSRSASIRRVDLGDKGGVFYRAQVGTFTTSEQATSFCNSLKDVGGQCIVQKN